ncbi:MAG: preprotein translocase subunit SecG [Leptospiraceae bacterium]|nr:preprotein translocase subunit SecG [Leptospiraceae bacterium]MCP5493655.1 preprotein translocase subunit SecG [Leptospiraceae bacterium]
MGFINGALLVIFILTCLLLILLVLVQSGKGGGLGGMFGGGGSSQSVFGSSSADIMTQTTRVVAIVFMVMALFMSFLYAKKPEIIPEEPGKESILNPDPAKDQQPVTEPKENNNGDASQPTDAPSPVETKEVEKPKEQNIPEKGKR